jgi:hypothetical protein
MIRRGRPCRRAVICHWETISGLRCVRRTWSRNKLPRTAWSIARTRMRNPYRWSRRSVLRWCPIAWRRRPVTWRRRPVTWRRRPVTWRWSTITWSGIVCHWWLRGTGKVQQISSRLGCRCLSCSRRCCLCFL